MVAKLVAPNRHRF